MPDFHNPYVFVRTPGRGSVPSNTFAGDADPRTAESHGMLHPNRFTGFIRLKVTAKTPLLLVRTPEVRDQNRHKTFDSLENLKSTAFKGALRTAYEAVTNSRMCIFAGHDDPLGFRTPATEAVSLVPGRIESSGSGRGLQVCVLRGRSYVTPAGAFRLGRNGQRERVAEGTPGQPGRAGAWAQAPMFAAWLRRYDTSATDPKRGAPATALPYAGSQVLPEHGEACWISLIRRNHQYPRFDYWEVDQIWPRNGSTPPAIGALAGYVCVSGPTIDKKHDERVFFEDPGLHRTHLYRPLDTPVIARYEALIRDYQHQHRTDLEDRRHGGRAPSDYIGPEPGRTAFGPYVFEPSSARLRPGDLVYVRIRNGQAVALYPAMISRDLHPQAPKQLVDESLRPATRIDELSPADRLLGWVRSTGASEEGRSRVEPAAWKGRLRIIPTPGMTDSVTMDGPFAPDGVPLANLGEPKPGQARFYLGDMRGNPLPDGTSKSYASYASRDRQLRGRKFYWHHRGLPQDYWCNPMQDRTQTNPAQIRYHQEYRRPNKHGAPQRDSQNRSVLRWIGEGSCFHFALHVVNASLEEIGALVYLASLPDGCYLRLGGGKPLGFGSVRVELDDDGSGGIGVRVASGKEWVEFYRSLTCAEPAWNVGVPDRAKDAFFTAMANAYGAPEAGRPGERFRSLEFIQDFEAACRGPAGTIPIHYPRIHAAPDPDGNNYEWFVANERPPSHPPGLSLPLAATGQGLPLIPAIGGTHAPTAGPHGPSTLNPGHGGGQFRTQTGNNRRRGR